MQKTASFKTTFQEYLKKRSSDYMQYGRYMAKELTYRDLWIRFISYLGDLAFMYFPIMLWTCLFLLTSATVTSYTILYYLTYPLYVVMIVFLLVANTIVIVLFKGQTFGKVAMNIKVVDAENKECSQKTLIIRELAGIELPILILSIVFYCLNLTEVLGLLVFSVLNGLVVLIDKHHRSWIDLVLKTRVVLLDENAKKATFGMVETKKEKKVALAENGYDLHVYSVYSHDGEVEVEDLFKQAQEAGVKALSICDHNCIKANNIAKKIAPLYEIQYIPGITIDCEFEGRPVRILGYFIDGNEDRFYQLENESLAKERAMAHRRIQLFEKQTGFTIDEEKLEQENRFQIITNEMIARQVLSNSEYRKNKLLSPYISSFRNDRPIANFVQDYFGEGSPCYVKTPYPSTKDMIGLVKASHGVPVLAQPMRYFDQEERELLEKLIQEGIEGLEVFTPFHTKADMNFLLDLAKQYHLDITAGSEYHGPNRPQYILGKTTCPENVEEIVKRFVEKHQC